MSSELEFLSRLTEYESVEVSKLRVSAQRSSLLLIDTSNLIRGIMGGKINFGLAEIQVVDYLLTVMSRTRQILAREKIFVLDHQLGDIRGEPLYPGTSIIQPREEDRIIREQIADNIILSILSGERKLDDDPDIKLDRRIGLVTSDKNLKAQAQNRYLHDEKNLSLIGSSYLGAVMRNVYNALITLNIVTLGNGPDINRALSAHPDLTYGTEGQFREALRDFIKGEIEGIISEDELSTNFDFDSLLLLPSLAMEASRDKLVSFDELPVALINLEINSATLSKMKEKRPNAKAFVSTSFAVNVMSRQIDRHERTLIKSIDSGPSHNIIEFFEEANESEIRFATVLAARKIAATYNQTNRSQIKPEDILFGFDFERKKAFIIIIPWMPNGRPQSILKKIREDTTFPRNLIRHNSWNILINRGIDPNNFDRQKAITILTEEASKPQTLTKKKK